MKTIVSKSGKKLITEPKKRPLVNELAGSFYPFVNKSKLRIPTNQAIEMAKNIAAKENAHDK